MALKRFILPVFLSFLVLTQQVFALSVPEVSGYVNDKAGIMNAKSRNELNEYLANLDQSTGIQIAVLTINSLENNSIEEYSLKVAEKWKLGNKEKDSGALLLISMKEHAVRIETGDGLEGILTDAKCGLIIRNIISPNFREGKYSAGIALAVQNMAGIALQDESLISDSVKKANDDDDDFLGTVYFIFFAFFFIVSVCSRRGRFPRWLVYSLLWNGASSGHRSSGGGSSFSGFSGGGGHFSGGGASGKW